MIALPPNLSQTSKLVYTLFKVVANNDLGCQRKWILTQRDYLILNPDFQPCPPFQSVVTEELIKWVWLRLKTVIIVKIMV